MNWVGLWKWTLLAGHHVDRQQVRLGQPEGGDNERGRAGEHCRKCWSRTYWVSDATVLAHMILLRCVCDRPIYFLNLFTQGGTRCFFAQFCSCVLLVVVDCVLRFDSTWALSVLRSSMSTIYCRPFLFCSQGPSLPICRNVRKKSYMRVQQFLLLVSLTETALGGNTICRPSQMFLATRADVRFVLGFVRRRADSLQQKECLLPRDVRHDDQGNRVYCSSTSFYFDRCPLVGVCFFSVCLFFFLALAFPSFAA